MNDYQGRRRIVVIGLRGLRGGGLRALIDLEGKELRCIRGIRSFFSFRTGFLALQLPINIGGEVALILNALIFYIRLPRWEGKTEKGQLVGKIGSWEAFKIVVVSVAETRLDRMRECFKCDKIESQKTESGLLLLYIYRMTESPNFTPQRKKERKKKKL